MEKKYVKPEMEIDTFETDDIITTSSETTPDYHAPNTPENGWG